jgi:chromosome segregation ATPase
VPSDIYAKNIRVYRPSQKTHFKESTNLNEGVDFTMDEKELKESLEKIEQEKKELENRLQELKESEKNAKEELESIKESLKNSNEELNKLKEANFEDQIKNLQESLEKSEQTLKEKETELSEEKALRESIETQNIEIKESSKTALIENYVLLRKIAGKSNVETEKVQERSQESLLDAIKDLKEELGAGFNISTISFPADVTLSENKAKDSKKDKKTSNIDLEEGLTSLFENIAGIHYKK